VDNLQEHEFDLRLDGRPQTISSFERVRSGSSREEAQLALARGGKVERVLAEGANSDAAAVTRGRVVFFFIDDLHLSFESIVRTRKLLQHFIDTEMGENDQAAIVSTTGQIGFLQQLTDEKTVLHAAAMQLNFRPQPGRLQDHERPPLSEFAALAIDRNDPDAVNYFTEQTLKENPGLPREMAEETVRMRARQILEQAAVTTARTLSTLEKLVRSATQLPGRKLVFFISDGLFLDTRTSNTMQRLESLVDAAARAAVVVYTMDARGLTSGLPDASSSVPADPTGRLTKINGGELSASQDVMHRLAEDTGGRALLNTNALDKALTRTLNETSVYYLIAWRPDRSEENVNKFHRITLGIKGHPELSVQVRRGFYALPQEKPAPKPAKTESKMIGISPKAVELNAALGSLYPRTTLPTYLSLSYTNTANAETTLTTTIQLDAGSYEMPLDEAASISTVDALCVVFNSKGKVVASVEDQIKFTSDATPTAATATRQESEQERRSLFTHQFRLMPGLYQVRVATHDNKNGRTGSAAQWIEIPDIASGVFALGSLLVAERTTEKASAQTGTILPETIHVSADHTFARTSQLRFVTFIYNAAVPPDVMLEVKILKDKQPVITMPFKQVETKKVADLARIPFAAEVALDQLAPGRYVLQVMVNDRAGKKSATRQFKFLVR
jgi:VWFA-related protein